MPDCSAIKFVYSDYRVLTAAANQADYIYRANSLFDPDATGVGGQPDGFDQWKTLYGVYRVLAVEVEVQAVGNGTSANGLLAVAPSEVSTSYASAEEVAGLRHATAAAYSPTQVAKVHKLWRIGSLLGRSDQVVLADPNCSAVLTTNPTTQYFVHIALETGNSATGQTMVWTKLTYYARLEVPIATIDTVRVHSVRFNAGLPPSSTTKGCAPSEVCDSDKALAATTATRSNGQSTVSASQVSADIVLTSDELALVLARRR